MASYFGVFIKRLMGQNPFAPEKPKKFEYQAPPAPKTVTYVKPKPAPKNSGLKRSYNPSFNPISLVMPVIMGIVGIQIFGSVYSALNTSGLGMEYEAFDSLFSMMPLVIILVIGASVLGAVATIFRISE